MIIRDCTVGDLAEIRAIHKAEGYTFELPNLEHPLVLVKKCAVDDRDRVRMAALGRLHISAILFVDGRYGTPTSRLEDIKHLQAEMDAAARAFGLDIATTQAAGGRFAERLEADLGWHPGYGQMYYRSF